MDKLESALMRLQAETDDELDALLPPPHGFGGTGYRAWTPCLPLGRALPFRSAKVVSLVPNAPGSKKNYEMNAG